MLHGATPAETCFAAPLHMFQLKVSTCNSGFRDNLLVVCVVKALSYQISRPAFTKIGKKLFKSLVRFLQKKVFIIFSCESIPSSDSIQYWLVFCNLYILFGGVLIETGKNYYQNCINKQETA